MRSGERAPHEVRHDKAIRARHRAARGKGILRSTRALGAQSVPASVLRDAPEIQQCLASGGATADGHIVVQFIERQLLAARHGMQIFEV